FSEYLTVVDVMGVHFLIVKYYTCDDAEMDYMQLLHLKLFLATLERPSTAFMFSVLNNFIQDNLECGTLGMNYYSKLHRVTSN
ncbi:hypothetical protein J3R82DRAFT_9432, partial [Butyriboletus roseoflavus]